MLRKLTRCFWRLVPHRHRWLSFGTKYGYSAWCARCGRSQVFMDEHPWGD